MRSHALCNKKNAFIFKKKAPTHAREGVDARVLVEWLQDVVEKECYQLGYLAKLLALLVLYWYKGALLVQKCK